jgi:hypothetical protein
MSAEEKLRQPAKGICKFILQLAQVVRDNQSIMVLSHSHSDFKGT